MARNYRAKPSKTTPNAQDTTSTALYIRVSTERQADEGNSLAAQQKKLREYCAVQGWSVNDEHIYIDAGISGKTTARPQYQAMLQAAQQGEIGRIVAMKLDRLARNVKDFLITAEQLKDWNCALVLVKESFDTSTPHGKFALTMFAAMAELEATTITERMLSGKAQNASDGGYNGSPAPIGYRYVKLTADEGTDKQKVIGKFIVDQEKAPTVRRIFDLFLAGHSLRAIARILNEDSTPTATGAGQWNAYGISHILRNGIYAGIMQWDGEEVNDRTPAIITRAVYDQAQALIKGREPRARVDLLKAAE